MATITIGGLTGKTPLATDEIEIQATAGGASNKATLAQVKTLMSASPSLVTPDIGTPTAGNLASCTGLPLATGVTGDLPLANLAQGSALSVLGVTGNATADNASIAAASDHQVMRRSGTAVAFGAVNLASSAAVTGILPIANIATGTPDGTKFVRDDGTLVAPSGGGSVATDAIWDAAGDLAVGSGANTAARLPIGGEGTFLGVVGGALTYATPAGSGDVVKVGTPANNQVGVWTGDGTIEGDAALSFDTATDLLTIGAGSITRAGAHALTITTTGTTGVTLPASGTLLASGGALGTPSSGAVTNLTGTASININGTVGATTPTTAVVTTLTVNTNANPDADDGAALGTTSLGWSDLFLASGAVLNYANGNAAVTHSSGVLTVSTGDLRVTTAGTNAASAVTVGGTQTLTGKSYTAPTFSGIVTMGAGASVFTASAMSGQAINVVSYFNTESNAVDRTFTFTGSPATGQIFTAYLTNSDSATHIYTLPTCIDISTGTSAAHTVAVNAGGKVWLAFRYNGSAYELLSKPGFLSKFDATAAPGVTNDLDEGYGAGSLWLDATGNAAYICESAANGAAVWHLLGGGNVTKVGTPTATRLGIWTGDGTLGDDANLSFNTTGDLLTVGAGSLTRAGAHSLTLTTSGTTDVTFPTSGTLLASGGALGTPSSGTVTNLTGTASININGTVGATTPAAGTFTTLTTTGNNVLGNAGTDTLDVGNGGLIKDASGNIGLGVTPTYKLHLSGNNTQLWMDTQATYVEQSTVGSAGANIDYYISTKGAGSLIFRNAGTTERMVIDGPGNVTIPGTLTFHVAAVPAADDTYQGVAISGRNAGATIAQWEAVYLDSSGTWQLADCNGSSTYPCRGLAVAAYSSTNAAIVVDDGVVRNDAWAWTVGSDVYLSATPGGLTQTAPSTSGDKVQKIGYALSADSIRVFIGTGEYLTVT